MGETAKSMRHVGPIWRCPHCWSTSSTADRWRPNPDCCDMLALVRRYPDLGGDDLEQMYCECGRMAELEIEGEKVCGVFQEVKLVCSVWPACCEDGRSLQGDLQGDLHEA